MFALRKNRLKLSEPRVETTELTVATKESSKRQPTCHFPATYIKHCCVLWIQTKVWEIIRTCYQ